MTTVSILFVLSPVLIYLVAALMERRRAVAEVRQTRSSRRDTERIPEVGLGYPPFLEARMPRSSGRGHPHLDGLQPRDPDQTRAETEGRRLARGTGGGLRIAEVRVPPGRVPSTQWGAREVRTGDRALDGIGAPLMTTAFAR